jgi:hypothetical protein
MPQWRHREKEEKSPPNQKTIIREIAMSKRRMLVMMKGPISTFLLRLACPFGHG